MLTDQPRSDEESTQWLVDALLFFVDDGGTSTVPILLSHCLVFLRHQAYDRS